MFGGGRILDTLRCKNIKTNEVYLNDSMATLNSSRQLYIAPTSGNPKITIRTLLGNTGNTYLFLDIINMRRFVSRDNFSTSYTPTSCTPKWNTDTKTYVYEIKEDYSALNGSSAVPSIVISTLRDSTFTSEIPYVKGKEFDITFSAKLNGYDILLIEYTSLLTKIELE